jgi:hypothetical protein
MFVRYGTRAYVISTYKTLTGIEMSMLKEVLGAGDSVKNMERGLNCVGSLL